MIRILRSTLMIALMTSMLMIPILTISAEGSSELEINCDDDDGVLPTLDLAAKVTITCSIINHHSEDDEISVTISSISGLQIEIIQPSVEGGLEARFNHGLCSGCELQFTFELELFEEGFGEERPLRAWASILSEIEIDVQSVVNEDSPNVRLTQPVRPEWPIELRLSPSSKLNLTGGNPEIVELQIDNYGECRIMIEFEQGNYENSVSVGTPTTPILVESKETAHLQIPINLRIDALSLGTDSKLRVDYQISPICSNEVLDSQIEIPIEFVNEEISSPQYFLIGLLSILVLIGVSRTKD